MTITPRKIKELKLGASAWLHQGITTREAAQLADVGEKTLIKYIRNHDTLAQVYRQRQGYRRNRFSQLSDAERENIALLGRGGMVAKEIAKTTDVNISTVYYVLKSYGIAPPRPPADEETK